MNRPQPGQVICYSYLWADEHTRGQEEGLKDRPCAVVMVLTQAGGGDRVVVLPITHTPPTDLASAVEIPAETKKRLRLDDMPSWIIVSEANRFTWPGPDFRPFQNSAGESTVVYGFLPPGLFRSVRERLRDLATVQHLQQIPRTE